MTEQSMGEHKTPNERTVNALIAALGSADDATRWEARHTLVALKQAAVPYLIQALKAPNERTRWEAAQALRSIADPVAAPALVNALEDSAGDVRWAAADALIALRDEGLAPLLHALAQRSDSILLRGSARHVLRILGLRHELKAVISPVLEALDGVEPALGVPIATQAALNVWGEKKRKR